jgi:hypothetical protein
VRTFFCRSQFQKSRSKNSMFSSYSSRRPTGARCPVPGAQCAVPSRLECGGDDVRGKGRRPLFSMKPSVTHARPVRCAQAQCPVVAGGRDWARGTGQWALFL